MIYLSSRMEEVAGRGGRRKKVAGRGGRRKKVTGKGGRHEEGVWSVEPDLFRSGGRRWKKVEEESPKKVCWEDESPVETDGWWAKGKTVNSKKEKLLIYCLLL
ncbi:hypothetical protein Tco_1236128 [Tanacetum coccineum]